MRFAWRMLQECLGRNMHQFRNTPPRHSHLPPQSANHSKAQRRETAQNSPKMTRDDKIPGRRRKTQQRASQTHSAPSSDLFTATVRSDLRAECVREYRFHPTRRWRFDYAIPAHHIAIEVEGGVWTGGRHTSPKGFLGDMEKYNTATLMGWRVFRTTPQELYSASTLAMLREAIENKQN